MGQTQGASGLQKEAGAEWREREPPNARLSEMGGRPPLTFSVLMVILLVVQMLKILILLCHGRAGWTWDQVRAGVRAEATAEQSWGVWSSPFLGDQQETLLLAPIPSQA